MIITNSTQKLAVILVALGSLFFFASCEKDNNKEPDQTDEELSRAILNNYVETTVVPTYKVLAEAAVDMRKATRALKDNPTTETMKAACDAWMKARIEWELSEAFLFGPVGDQALDVDGHIDSWPLELEAIKQSIDAGGNITAKQAWLLDPEVIGFHVTEYLLYREGQPRPVADLIAKPAEFNYLAAATEALVWDCVLAYVAWVGEDNVSAEMKTIFNENQDLVEHLNNNPNYKNFASVLKNATGIYQGELGAALGEIAVGAAEIAGEVGATKIEAPYENHRVEEVESWYSWHSLDDYQNNILSIKNAYLGGLNDNSRTEISLSTFIAKKDSQLDAAIKAKIEDCLTKIKAIGKGNKSFYEVVRDRINATEVDAAVEACIELQTLFDSIAEII